MTLFQWDESFATGINQIDDQHRKLIGIVNRLQEAMAHEAGDAVLLDIIRELKEYAIYHFETEERYMVSFDYPGLEGHSAEHDRFVEEVSGFQRSHEQGKPLISVPVMSFLVKWITDHVKGTDRQYVPLFRERGLV